MFVTPRVQNIIFNLLLLLNMVNMNPTNIGRPYISSLKVNETIHNMKKEFKGKKIMTLLLKDSNMDRFENVLTAIDDIISMENACVMIIEPVAIKSSAKEEVLKKIDFLEKNHGRDTVYYEIPETEVLYKAYLEVSDLGIFVQEYSICFKEMTDFARLNKSNILIEQSSSSPIKATKVNFDSKAEIVETISKCLLKKNPHYEENQHIISGLQSMNSISKILSESKTNENMKIPVYLTEKHIKSIINAFKQAQTRAIILDYDGTLADLAKRIELAFPRKDLKELLKNLGEIPNCDLVICTGRTKQYMDEYFPYYQNLTALQTLDPELDQTIFGINMTIYAEHTAAKRLKDKWYKRKLDLSFFQVAHDIIKKTHEILPGSIIEVKDAGFAFHYRQCDQKVVAQPIKQMIESLSSAIGKTANVIPANCIVEVNAKDISKNHCIKQYIDRKFILCAGDDITDEEMFKIDCCSILVGNKPSHAKYRVNTPKELKQILRRIYEAVSFGMNE